MAISAVRADDVEGEVDSEFLMDYAPPIKSELPYWKKSAHWLEDSRDTWSERVDWMARGIDRFFAGEETLAFGNKSYVRFRAGGAWVEGEGYVDNTDIKFRLHL